MPAAQSPKHARASCPKLVLASRLFGRVGKFPYQIHGKQVFEDGPKVNAPRGNGECIGGFRVVARKSLDNFDDAFPVY